MEELCAEKNPGYWKLLCRRMATKENLIRQGNIQEIGDPRRVLCKEEDKNTSHVFFLCKFSRDSLTMFYQWFEIDMVAHKNPVEHFFFWQHSAMVGRGKSSRLVDTIWIGPEWSIWKVRNDVIFNGKGVVPATIWDEIRARVWLWLTMKTERMMNISLSEWIQISRSCCMMLVLVFHTNSSVILLEWSI